MSATNRKRFKSALKSRGAEIAAIRDLGWSWSDVAAHFENDSLLGGSSSKCLSSAWSRLLSEGWAPDETNVLACRTEILMVGGLRPGMWVLEHRSERQMTTGGPTGEEADVVRRMRLAAKLAKSGQDKAID